MKLVFGEKNDLYKPRKQVGKSARRETLGRRDKAGVSEEGQEDLGHHSDQGVGEQISPQELDRQTLTATEENKWPLD